MPMDRNSLRTVSRYAVSSVISRLMASRPYVRAAQPSATCSSTRRLPASFASSFTCSMMARSVGVPSSVTRMVSYMVLAPSCTSPAGNDLPCRFQRIGQTEYIHRRNQDRAGPSGGEQKPSILPPPHPLPRTGELQQRKHGKRQLQRQDYLTQRQKISDAAITTQADDKHCREDRQHSCDQAANPGLNAPVHEAFHHHLAGEGAGDGAALAARQ